MIGTGQLYRADPGQDTNLCDAGDPLVQHWQERLREELRRRAVHLRPVDGDQGVDSETEEMLRAD